ncbi:MAG: nucleotidyltransferase family protein [Proteobacteria bacterium]|nr:nucleotidyltransferase family protein [Pseudomonadota bacterium]MCH9013973.1 nucleotidyltransferase family protein [Pseudomonadota bacterium]
MPQRAMVLAAGLGERMRPITDTLPKPLIELRGRTLLDSILDRVEAAGVPEAVINLHYLGEMIEARLVPRERPRVSFSHEETRLETGGGVRKALSLLGADAFFVINGDVCWLDGHTPALERLAAAWDDEEMDALLLLHPTAFAVGYAGVGDFVLAPDGRMRRRRESEVSPFVFTGIQILHPRLFEDAPEEPFSLNLIYDKAGAAERLWGLRHDGEWFHIGTPEGLRDVEDALHPLSEISDQR